MRVFPYTPGQWVQVTLPPKGAQPERVYTARVADINTVTGAIDLELLIPTPGGLGGQRKHVWRYPSELLAAQPAPDPFA